LIGCDGGKSAVRKSVGTEFEGFTWPERFIVVSTGADFAPHGFTSNAYVADPKEWAAVFHMPGRLGAWLSRSNPDGTRMRCSSARRWRRRMQRFVARPGRYDVMHKGIYKVHQRVAKEWRAGRILLAGDAAHLNNPLGAFGLNGGCTTPSCSASASASCGAARRAKSCSTSTCASAARRTSSSCRRSPSATRRLLEEADPMLREAKFAELRRIAADKELARDFLIRSFHDLECAESRRSDLNWSTVAWQNADKTTSMEILLGSAMKSFVHRFDWRLFPVDRLALPPSGAWNP